jgi:hypothetical protein
MLVSKYNDLWDHTVMRITNAEKKRGVVDGNHRTGDYEKFVNDMVVRLKRITHVEKLHYAIAVLKERGHEEVVQIYEGRLMMEKFLECHRKGR